ncbi:arf-GAP with dual PH domain-containing protein 1-like [Sycon ciliatum]|uniref:arf-GAP with dual PH domain-containing protein 1-like n=1 Tax=Sycon ciliatum TaxID=27933 RepID=UPI0020A86687|eukprot:scpid71272/ scgid33956/ Arf-GAP with dual PH domain-containing protein 1; Centaurin-alpha-1; Putative MAPK-activating protein PM25
MNGSRRNAQVLAKLDDVLKKAGNEKCAECFVPDPEWASTNLGVFLCIHCSGVHRRLGVHISQVKSLKLDDKSWTQEMVDNLETVGNVGANEHWAKHVPLAFKRPRPDERPDSVLREQWIRAKYERKEFLSESHPAYLCGARSGLLYKKGKGRNEWKPRWFVMNQKEGSLSYFKSRSSAKRYGSTVAGCAGVSLKIWDKPLGVIHLRQANACFAHDVTGHPHSLQIIAPDGPGADGKTRNLFVYSEAGQDIVEWMVAIRHARLCLLKVTAGDMLTRDFTKAGYLDKTGPTLSNGWRKRWFVLDGRRLRYYGSPLDPFELNDIDIGTEAGGYSVHDGITDRRRTAPQYGITLVTPSRTFYMNSSSIDEHRAWLTALRQLVETPLEASVRTM